MPVTLTPTSISLSVTHSFLTPHPQVNRCSFRTHILQAEVKGMGASLFVKDHSPLPFSFLSGCIISSHIILINASFDMKPFYVEIKNLQEGNNPIR